MPEMTREEFTAKYGYPPDQPSTQEGMTREEVIAKHGFDPLSAMGGQPPPSMLPSDIAHASQPFIERGLSFAAKEGPKAIGAAGGAALATGLGQPELIVPFAAGGATLAEAMRMAIASGFNLPQAPQSANEAMQRLFKFPTGAVYEGGLQEVGTAYRAGKFASSPSLARNIQEGMPTSPTAMLAQEFKVPVTPAQVGQGKVQSAIEGFTRKTIFGQQIFDKFDRRVATRLSQAAEDLMTWLSPKNMTLREWGTAMQDAISEYTTRFGTEYDSALNQISAAGGSKARLDVKGLSEPAQALLQELSPPAAYEEAVRGPLGASIVQALKTLRAFAKPTKTVTTPASSILGPTGKPAVEAATEEVEKELTFEGARRLRSILFIYGHSGPSNKALGAINRMNEALDKSMGESLNTPVMKPLYDRWHAASANYRSAIETVENAVVKAISKNATPEEIAKGVISSGSESKLRLLSKIAPELRQQTGRAIFQAAYERSVKESILLGDSIEQILGDIPGAKLSPQAKAILFPGPQGDKISRFINLVDTISLRRGLTKPTSAQTTPLAAIGQGGGLLYMGEKVVENVIEGDATGLALSVFGAGFILLGPAAVAKLITRPGVTDMATKALTTKLNSAAGRALSYRLAAALGIPQFEATPELQATPGANMRVVGDYDFAGGQLVQRKQ